MRKTWTIGAVALLAGILMMPNYQAVARGGGGGFHGGGGGFHGGFGGGGFRGGGFGGFRGGGFGRFGGFRGGFGRFGGGRFGRGFGFYGGYGAPWYSGYDYDLPWYGYYDPSTVAPDEQLTYPAPVVQSPPAPDAKVVSKPVLASAKRRTRPVAPWRAIGEVPAAEENFAMKANSTAGSHGRNGCRE